MPSSGESLLPPPKPKKSSPKKSPKKSSPKPTTKIEPTLPTSKGEMEYLRELIHGDPEKAEVLKKQLMKSAKKSPKLSLLEEIEIEDRKRQIRRQREAEQSFRNRQQGKPKKPKSKRIPRRKKSKRGGRGRKNQDWEKNEGYYGPIMNEKGKLDRDEICRYCSPADYAKGARKFCKLHHKVWDSKTNSCKKSKRTKRTKRSKRR